MTASPLERMTGLIQACQDLTAALGPGLTPAQARLLRRMAADCRELARTCVHGSAGSVQGSAEDPHTPNRS